MTQINITGCHRCQPEKWKKTEIPTIGTYWCINCRKIVTQVLERNISAQKFKEKLEAGDQEIEGYRELKDNLTEED